MIISVIKNYLPFILVVCSKEFVRYFLMLNFFIIQSVFVFFLSLKVTFCLFDSLQVLCCDFIILCLDNFPFFFNYFLLCFKLFKFGLSVFELCNYVLLVFVVWIDNLLFKLTLLRFRRGIAAYSLVPHFYR